MKIQAFYVFCGISAVAGIKCAHSFSGDSKDAGHKGMYTPESIIGYMLGVLKGEAGLKEQPAEKFEQKVGLSGISGGYKFPAGMQAGQFDLWATYFCGGRNGPEWLMRMHLQGVWNRLVDLNPSLATVKTYDDVRALSCGIAGAASQFNPDDIQFFIDMQHRTKGAFVAFTAAQVDSYARISDAIERHVGHHMEWVAAPETLKQIFDQVKDRPAAPEGSLRQAFYIPSSSYWQVSGMMAQPEAVAEARAIIGNRLP